jgi:hypothetical protein
MLYLVGGSSRSGKTLIARRILQRTGAPYLSLDWIVMGFTNGMPQLGIHDKLFPHEIAERMQTFFESMCDSILWTGEDLVVEGEAFLPESARKLVDSHPDAVSACFLGYAQVQVKKKVSETKSFSEGERDWLLQESDEVIHQHIRNMVEHSRKVEAQCAEHDVRYFDTSTDFPGTLDLATEYLLSGT